MRPLGGRTDGHWDRWSYIGCFVYLFHLLVIVYDVGVTWRKNIRLTKIFYWKNNWKIKSKYSKPPHKLTKKVEKYSFPIKQVIFPQFPEALIYLRVIFGQEIRNLRVYGSISDILEYKKKLFVLTQLKPVFYFYFKT